MTQLKNQYAEQATLSTTTSSTYVAPTNDCKILGSALDANTKYLIIARALFNVSDIGANAAIRVVTADDTTIATKSEAQMEPNQTNTARLLGYQFVRSYSTNGTPADIEFEFKTIGFTTAIDQMTLELLDLTDLGSANFVEASDDTNAEVAVQTSWTNLATLAALDASTEYLLLGYVRAAIGHTNRSFQVQLQGTESGGSSLEQLTQHQAEGEDTNELRMVGVAGRHNSSASLQPLLRMNEEVAAANMFSDGSYLIALKTSAFEDFEYDFTAGTVGITGTETALATVSSYTPTTAGDHLIVGRFNNTTAGNTASLVGYVEDDGTAIFTGDEVTTQTQRWDSDDAETVAVVARENLPASASTLVLNSIILDSETGVNAEFRFLGVLSLELAAAAPAVYPPFPRRQLTTVRM